jgi:hypothetical protein
MDALCSKWEQHEYKEEESLYISVWTVVASLLFNALHFRRRPVGLPAIIFFRVWTSKCFQNEDVSLKPNSPTFWMTTDFRVRVYSLSQIVPF